MHFSKTLLFALSAAVAAQQSSDAQPENPATGFLQQTNADGAVTGQPHAATSQTAAVTSQDAAATVPASGTTGLVPSETGGSTMATQTNGQHTGSESATGSSTASKTKTGTSTSTPTSDSDSSSSSAASTGGAVQTAAPVGLGMSLAGAALAAFL